VVTANAVAFYALAWHRGHLVAGTGNDGKLFRLDDRSLVQLADLDESQITALASLGDALFLATANPGQVYQVAADHAASGTLLSEVYDTGSIAQWGHASWDARGGEVSLATRTGNTPEADASWSAWSEDQTKPAGQPVASPPARFIQYRVTLKRARDGASPLLDDVVIAYVRANEPPRVTEVQVGKPPKRRPETSEEQRPPEPAPQVSRSLTTQKQPAARLRGPFGERIRIAWAANDPNSDGLLFAVYFRGEDETAWKKIQDRLRGGFADWDTTAVPDGPYRFRVVATDALTNPPTKTLQGEFVTEPITLDNTPPAVSDLKSRVNKERTVTLTCRAADAGSRVDAAEYAVDGGDWTSLAASDGIFDAASETIEFTTESLSPGEHAIVVRARDEAENTGAAKVVVTIK
jgi:hypothetical protein